MKRIAIQGGAGAYHEIAARTYFEEAVEIVPCLTFPDLFKVTEEDDKLMAIMAIENTIAGGLLPNHDLLRTNELKIAGEQKIRISHVLAVLPGQQLEDIKEVMSHPMALMQCGAYLNAMEGVKVVEHEDTALAAKEIAEEELAGVAAICSELAAKMYGLEILAHGIETNKRNFTRFLILAHEEMVPGLRKSLTIDKASIVFTLPHEEGTLSQVLSVLSFYNINLTRIQSLPIVGIEWEHQFYVDVTFADYKRYQQALEAILPLVGQLKILGEYKEDKQIVNK